MAAKQKRENVNQHNYSQNMSHKPHTSSSDRTWGTQDIWNKEGKQ